MARQRSTDPVARTTAVYDAHAERYVAAYRSWSPAAGASDLVALTLDAAPDGAAVLDVGCGSGRDLARLRAAGAAAVGIDLSSGLARHAVAHGPVVVADVRRLPFRDATFDAALAAASLHHLPDRDARRAVAELHRTLRGGARLVLSVKAGTGASTDPDGRFFRRYRDDQLDDLLAREGFEVEHRAREDDDRRVQVTWLVRVARRR